MLCQSRATDSGGSLFWPLHVLPSVPLVRPFSGPLLNMSDLTSLIRAALAEGNTVPAERRYFGVPLKPVSGPLAGHYLTVYRGGRDPEVQELLARRHDAYVDCLRLAGIRVPETHLRLIDDAGVQRPVIVQKSVADDTMLEPLFRKAGPKAAIGLLDRVATDVAEFWRRVAQRPERVGFHAKIERFGMDEDGPLFLDTFPPLISYSRDEMGHLIQRFADNGLVRGLGKVLPGRLRDMQDRWYTPAGSVQTLIDGALRLRPNDAEEVLDWADGFAKTRLEGPWRNAVQAQLARQARAAKANPGRWGTIAGRDRPHA